MKKLLLVLLVTLGLQTQAQINPCDSIDYFIISFVNPTPSGTNIIQLNGEANGILNMIDSTNWSWSVCNSTACFSGTGQVVSFSQFHITDTLKVCLDITFNMLGTTYTCMQICDSVVFDGCMGGWVFMHQINNPTHIDELELPISFSDNKIYDLQGRELTYIPVGTIYIKNKKKYIKIK